jgi:hypothetical protein
MAAWLALDADWLKYVEQNRRMMMPRNCTKESSPERHPLAEEWPQGVVPVLIKNKLNASNVLLGNVHIVGTGDGTGWGAQVQIEADLLLVTLRIFTESGRAVIHVAVERPADADGIRPYQGKARACPVR